MTDGPQHEPAQVPARAPQAGEVRARWAWAEAAVWTERMLTALEDGVKGDVWFRLVDKVYARRNLQAAWEKVRANEGAAGVDHVSVERFAGRADEELARLERELHARTWRPGAVRRTYIPKGPGAKALRPLGIPTVRDRIVQGALRHVLEPIFERDFADQSYGFRPGRGCKDALRRVEALLKGGRRWVVDADLKSYFDTIPHGKLMARVREKVADGSVLALIEAFLKAGVLDGMREWTPEEGTPQGAVISPLLANIYLDPLDHEMARAGREMVRYADDFVILCRNREEAETALEAVRRWTEAAGLTLHPEKTRIVQVDAEGFDFLGYHFQGRTRWPREKSLKKLRDTIRAKTRRTNGQSLTTIIGEVNQTLRGWFAYFKHSHGWTFPRIDQWLRMRLRSVLRKRRGGRGRGRGADHQRWPNAYFAGQGLYSLTEAHAQARQPA